MTSKNKTLDDLFVVLDVSDKHICDKQYFDELNSILKDEQGNYRKEVMEALLYQYMNWDISNFDPRNIPKGCRFSDHYKIKT